MPHKFQIQKVKRRSILHAWEMQKINVEFRVCWRRLLSSRVRVGLFSAFTCFVSDHHLASNKMILNMIGAHSSIPGPYSALMVT